MHRLLLIPMVWGCLLFGQTHTPRTTFRVKYVAEGSVYLDGGRNAGLSEGMKLTVKRDQAVAELEVTAIAAASAVCEIKSSQAEIESGDTAYLSPQDVETMQAMQSSVGTRKYAQVVTFTEGDPLEEEVRASVPRPPSPAVNRARGRIGFEYNTIRQGGLGGNSSQLGLVFRADITRIGGSYWNLSGHWRGRMNNRTGGARTETMSDLLNRTYHLTLSYENPQSRLVAGFGRLYLPWASSLETIDGGYFGRRFGRSFTAGVLAGSTPDPTSWNYAPGRQLLGSFVNYTSGRFESAHVSSTAGVAVSRIHWRPERQFAFFENSLLFKRYLSVYHNLEADQLKHQSQPADNGVRLSRSFLTVRLQPLKVLSLDFSHNYFRITPTFDPRLLGTGLLDKMLFQGANAGFRLDLPLRLAVYGNFGRSSRTGDSRGSLNQMYGLSQANLFRTGMRADVRYSKFDSSFGRGAYRALSLSREIGEVLRFELQAGDQRYTSSLTSQSRSRFVTGTVDWFFSRHYSIGGGYTLYRSGAQNYDQVYTNLSYRF